MPLIFCLSCWISGGKSADYFSVAGGGVFTFLTTMDPEPRLWLPNLASHFWCEGRLEVDLISIIISAELRALCSYVAMATRFGFSLTLLRFTSSMDYYPTENVLLRCSRKKSSSELTLSSIVSFSIEFFASSNLGMRLTA